MRSVDPDPFDISHLDRVSMEIERQASPLQRFLDSVGPEARRYAEGILERERRFLGDVHGMLVATDSVEAQVFARDIVSSAHIVAEQSLMLRRAVVDYDKKHPEEFRITFSKGPVDPTLR